MESISLTDCDLGALDSLSADSIEDILDSWNGFCSSTEALLSGDADVAIGSTFVSQVHSLCSHGLLTLVKDHFFQSLEVQFHLPSFSGGNLCYNA